jgi:hypothetical protein
MRRRLIGGLPPTSSARCPGLTQGHFPVHATARYAGAVSAKDARRKVGQGARTPPARRVQRGRRGIDIFAKAGSPPSRSRTARSSASAAPSAGHFVQLRDLYGNTYTYAHLKKTATAYPVPKERSVSKEDIAKELALRRATPSRPRPRRPAASSPARRPPGPLRP